MNGLMNSWLWFAMNDEIRLFHALEFRHINFLEILFLENVWVIGRNSSKNRWKHRIKWKNEVKNRRGSKMNETYWRMKNEIRNEVNENLKKKCLKIESTRKAAHCSRKTISVFAKTMIKWQKFELNDINRMRKAVGIDFEHRLRKGWLLDCKRIFPFMLFVHKTNYAMLKTAHSSSFSRHHWRGTWLYFAIAIRRSEMNSENDFKCNNFIEQKKQNRKVNSFTRATDWMSLIGV